MYVVIHEAISPDLNLIFLCITCQQFQIDLSIIVIKEHGSAVVAALGDVMRIAGD